MKDGNQNKGQNNKNSKRGFNKYNPNERMVGNNETNPNSYFPSNKKHRKYPNNGKEEFNPNTNPNFRKNRKKKNFQFTENNSNLYQNPKQSNEDYLEQQQNQNFQNNKEQINNINDNMNKIISEDTINSINLENNNNILSQIQNQKNIPIDFINNQNKKIEEKGNRMYEQYNQGNNNPHPNNNININNNNKNKNYSMYINPSLLGITSNINDNISSKDNTIQKQSINDSNISEGKASIYINPYINQMNYQQNDLNNLMNSNNYIQNDNFNPQQIYPNNLYQPNNNKRNNSQYNNFNNINNLGNNNNIKQFPNYNNNINLIGNNNFTNNIKNNRINIVPQIYEQEPKQQILREINSIPNYNNLEMNNKMNLNLNNNQFAQNILPNRNNIINYSPLSNPNLFPQNPNFQNMYSPTIIQNNPINLKNNLSLSSQSAKNTNPNFNINSMDNLNLNTNFIPSIPFNINNPNAQIIVANVGDRQNGIPFHVNYPNNLSLNNFMMKNNMNNNNHNNKNNLYKGRKKDHNSEFNDNTKKNNSYNRINKFLRKLKNTNDKILNYPIDMRLNQLLEINLKKGDKIINLNIYRDNYMEVIEKIKSEFGVNDNYINVILDKVKIAIDSSKEVFTSKLNNYYYKQVSNLIKIYETKNRSYIGTNRKSKSLKGKVIINRFKNNDVKLNIYDIKKTANLNNSF